MHTPFTRPIWSLSTSITMSSDSPGREWSRLLCIQSPSSLKPIYLSEKQSVSGIYFVPTFLRYSFSLAEHAGCPWIVRACRFVLRFLDEFISPTKRRKTCVSINEQDSFLEKWLKIQKIPRILRKVKEKKKEDFILGDIDKIVQQF
ncbi:hypothetical protein CDAR_233421 [Caerostris darwini]|uniref:Uncharacterized protein n=1 Tax=Caerostris darwini TaxID=1538125 RepID=A0AAV4PPG9_9ARAC|nr:hypothetical protein CDAR_233421 [Caerostris darwini]